MQLQWTHQVAAVKSGSRIYLTRKPHSTGQRNAFSCVLLKLPMPPTAGVWEVEGPRQELALRRGPSHHTPRTRHTSLLPSL